MHGPTLDTVCLQNKGVVSLFVNNFRNSDAANGVPILGYNDRTIRNRIRIWPQQKDAQTRDPLYILEVNACCGPHSNIC